MSNKKDANQTDYPGARRKRMLTVPYGFDVMSDGKLVENAAEQKAIGLIGKLRRKGYSLRAIAGTLKERAINSKTGKTWSATTVSRVLKRSATGEPV